MKKSQLNKLIEECILEYISEQSSAPLYKNLSDALRAVEEYVIKNSIQVDISEHPSNEADEFGIRGPFLYGGIPYEQKKDAHYKLLAYKGRPTKKYLHVSVYRMPSGNYELTCYVS